MNKKNGFTLVELLVVMAIVVSLAVMLVGIINPVAMVAKARDSQRKSDLVKIKKAFEEYFNDKGYYPLTTDLQTWNVTSNCDKNISDLTKYLDKWPCDPKGSIYTIISEDNWFKAVTNLENKKDEDIPTGWYDSGTYSASAFNKDSVNYGVSSSNVLWYEGDAMCDLSVCRLADCNSPPGNTCDEKVNPGGCYFLSKRGICNDPLCKVKCCGVGCIE